MRSTCFTDAILNVIDAQKVRPNHGGIHYVELRKSAPDGMIQEPYIDAPPSINRPSSGAPHCSSIAYGAFMEILTL